MSQLRPLLSVMEQYRLDLQTLATLRAELLKLSVILAAIQEEIGAYDYEELQQRVLLLETRLHSCMNKLGTGWRFSKALNDLDCCRQHVGAARRSSNMSSVTVHEERGRISMI